MYTCENLHSQAIKNFHFSQESSSMLNPFWDDCHSCSITKMEKKKEKKRLIVSKEKQHYLLKVFQLT